MASPCGAADQGARLQQLADAAVAAAEDGDFSTAAASFTLALQLAPGSAALHEQLAQCFMELEQHEAALVAAEAATALQPDWRDAWVTLGRALLNTGRPQAAVEAFSRSLALQPAQLEGPGQLDVQQELQEATQLAQQLVALQVGLPDLAISTDPAGQSGPGCVIWPAGTHLARLLVSCSSSSSSCTTQQQSCTAEESATAGTAAAGTDAADNTAPVPASQQQRSVWMRPAGARVLEVGAGTGIVGITAAALGAHVTLTDLPELQQLLAANIAANARIISAAGGSAVATVLDWNSLAGSSGQGHQDPGSSSSSSAALLQRGAWDWATGADLVFNAGQVELVVRMIAALLGAGREFAAQQGSIGSSSSSSSSSAGCAGFLLAHKQRHQQVDQQLQDALQLAGLHAAVVAQQQQQQQRHGCCHEHEQQQQQGSEQQQLLRAACVGQQCPEAAQLLEHDAGSVTIWWITKANRHSTAGGRGQVQQDLQQPQHCQRQRQLPEPQQQKQAETPGPPSSEQSQGQQCQQQQRRWQQKQRRRRQQRDMQHRHQQHYQKQRPCLRRPCAALQWLQLPVQQRLPKKLLLLSAGLAGVGKSTVLRLLSARLGSGCVYLDKDTINAALLGDKPYFSDYYRQHVQQQTYAVMFGIAADNLAARQQCVVLLDGQFGDKLTARYVQPYLQAIRTGQALDFRQLKAGSSNLGLLQQQQQQEKVAAEEEQKHSKPANGSSSAEGCLVVLLLFDTGGRCDLQLQRLRTRALVRDEAKYGAFEQYRLQELQQLQQQLALAEDSGLLDGVVEVDTSSDPAACVEDIMAHLALLGRQYGAGSQ